MPWPQIDGSGVSEKERQGELPSQRMSLTPYGDFLNLSETWQLVTVVRARFYRYQRLGQMVRNIRYNSDTVTV